MVNLNIVSPAIDATSMRRSQPAVAKDNEDEGKEPRPFNSELPKNTPSAIGINAKAVKTFVRRAQADSGGAVLNILFIAVPSDVIQASESRPEIIGGKGIRVYTATRVCAT